MEKIVEQAETLGVNQIIFPDDDEEFSFDFGEFQWTKDVESCGLQKVLHYESARKVAVRSTSLQNVIEEIRQSPANIVNTIVDSALQEIHQLKLLSISLDEKKNFIDFYGFAFHEINHKTYLLRFMEVMDMSLREFYGRVHENTNSFPKTILGHITVQTIKGLTFLQKNNINGLGLTSDTILVNQDGGVKLSDRSLAMTTDSSLYWSPERLIEKSITNPVDHDTTYYARLNVWSLGIILCEVVNNGISYKNIRPADVEWLFKNKANKKYDPETLIFVKTCLYPYDSRPGYESLQGKQFYRDHCEIIKGEISNKFLEVLSKVEPTSTQPIKPKTNVNEFKTNREKTINHAKQFSIGLRAMVCFILALTSIIVGSINLAKPIDATKKSPPELKLVSHMLVSCGVVGVILMANVLLIFKYTIKQKNLTTPSSNTEGQNKSPKLTFPFIAKTVCIVLTLIYVAAMETNIFVLLIESEQIFINISVSTAIITSGFDSTLDWSIIYSTLNTTLIFSLIRSNYKIIKGFIKDEFALKENDYNKLMPYFLYLTVGCLPLMLLGIIYIGGCSKDLALFDILMVLVSFSLIFNILAKHYYKKRTLEMPWWLIILVISARLGQLLFILWRILLIFLSRSSLKTCHGGYLIINYLLGSFVLYFGLYFIVKQYAQTFMFAYAYINRKREETKVSNSTEEFDFKFEYTKWHRTGSI